MTEQERHGNVLQRQMNRRWIAAMSIVLLVAGGVASMRCIMSARMYSQMFPGPFEVLSNADRHRPVNGVMVEYPGWVPMSIRSNPNVAICVGTISRIWMSDATPTRMSPVRSVRRLKLISISGSVVESGRVFSLIGECECERLEFHGAGVSNDAMRLATACSGLRSVYCHDEKFLTVGGIAKAIADRDIRDLHLGYVRVGQEMEWSTLSSAMPACEDLTIMGDEDVPGHFFFSLGRVARVRSMHLVVEHISVESIAAAAKMPSLQRLIVDGASVSPSDLLRIRRTSRAPHIEFVRNRFKEKADLR
jgi:hypothetical protein